MIDIFITLIMFPKLTSFLQELHNVHKYVILLSVSQISTCSLYVRKCGIHILL
jgi:hypothetical protein